MNVLQDSLLELIRRTSAEIPDDVQAAILSALEREKTGSIAASAMALIDRNIELARQKSQPICQDTGSIPFYVDCPWGFDQIAFADTARETVKLATKKGYLRQNSVDSITGKNVPPPLLAQLADGGKLVIPVGDLDMQSLIVCTRRGERFDRKQIHGFKFVPLIGKMGWR